MIDFQKLNIDKIYSIIGLKLSNNYSEQELYEALEIIEKEILAHARETKNNEERLSNVLEVITALAKFDYGKKAVISNEKDYYDAVALGVNMLGEELQASTISLKEKEILLKEIHHRVKNNLQIISSLLNLQSERIDDTLALQKFKESQNRVRSMALIHEKLYESKNFERVDFSEYINSFVNIIYDNYNLNNANVSLHIDFDKQECLLPIDVAIPCALILNELISNAFKYAFDNKKSGNLYLRFNKLENSFCKIEVQDDGIGMASSFELNKSTTLGLQLVDMLAQQIGGSLLITTPNEGGTNFIIRFQIK